MRTNEEQVKPLRVDNSREMRRTMLSAYSRTPPLAQTPAGVCEAHDHTLRKADPRWSIIEKRTRPIEVEVTSVWIVVVGLFCGALAHRLLWRRSPTLFWLGSTLIVVGVG